MGFHLLLWVCKAGTGKPKPKIEELVDVTESAVEYGCARFSISFFPEQTELASVYVRFKLTRLEEGADFISLL
jgi:hypothetical protein